MYCPVAARVRFPGKRTRLQDNKPIASPNKPCVLSGQKAPLIMVRPSKMVPKSKRQMIHVAAPNAASPRGTILMDYPAGIQPPPPCAVLKSYYSLLASGKLPTGMSGDDGRKPHTYSPHMAGLHQWRLMWRDYERYLLLSARNGSTQDKQHNPSICPTTPADTPRMDKASSSTNTNQSNVILPRLGYTKHGTKSETHVSKSGVRESRSVIQIKCLIGLL